VVDQILAAVEALEELLGGPQDYVEINADPQMVSLITFDAATSQARAYRYLGGVITPASEAFSISGWHGITGRMDRVRSRSHLWDVA
jgi:hypothetical protein